MSRSPLAHRVEYGLFVGVRALVSALPEPLADALGAGLGAFAGGVLRIRRADVDRHLAWAFPELGEPERERIARASFRHLGREAVTLFRLGGWSRQRVVERTTVTGLEAVRDALEDAGGALLLTGHLGNWEVGGAALAARGVPVDAVAKGMANRRFEHALFQARERLGMRVVEIQDAPREALRALRSGRAVAMVADQNAHRNGVFVPFFGRAASTYRGPALFALRTGVPVFVAFALRRPGPVARYHIAFERLEVDPMGDQERDVRAFAEAYMVAVERAVRDHPDQYFWQHKRWKTRPPQEPAGREQVEPRSSEDAPSVSLPPQRPATDIDR